MKMRIVIMLSLATLVFFLPVFSASGADKDPDTGRYQLFEGTYNTYDLKRQQTYTSTGVFLIDTKTGIVKRYVNRIDEDGKYIETWLPTETLTEKK